MVVLILFGPPGSGKGTQGKAISEKLGIPHIATGDIMREAVIQETELGKKVKEYMGKGGLVPDDIVIGIIEERLSRDDVKNGFILDGFPRTIPQAESLEKLFGKLGIDDYRVVFIDVPDDEIVKRLSGRRTCSVCGAVYNIYFDPPRVKGICDKCGGTLYIRDDDEEDKVKKRLEVYREKTAPVLSFYEKKGKVLRINGVGKLEEVRERIISALGINEE